jgi:hypothetical protein
MSRHGLALRRIGLALILGVLASAPLSAFRRSSLIDLPLWRTEPGPGGVETRVVQLPFEQTSYDLHTHALVRRVVDRNQDGVSDRIITYEGLGGARLEEMDTDFDGRVDRWDTFGATGQRLRSASARTGSRPDRVASYDRAGLLDRVETDADLDGIFEVVQIHEAGRLAETRIDTDGNGRVDRIQDFRAGYLAFEDFDTNEDGRSDLRLTFAKDGTLINVSTTHPDNRSAAGGRR